MFKVSAGRDRSSPKRDGGVRAVLATLVAAFLACGKGPPTQQSTSTPPAASAATSPAQVGATPSAEIQEAIAAALASARGDLCASADEQKELVRIYPPAAPDAVWVERDRHLTKSAMDALGALGDAAAEGLDPSDYRAQPLAALAKTLDSGTPRDAASFDVSLSLSMMRYLHHFHHGRVNPRDIGFLITLPNDEHDYAALVRDAATQSRVKETIGSMAPPLVQYRLLRSMLPKYRALALLDGSTLPHLPKAPAKSV